MRAGIIVGYKPTINIFLRDKERERSSGLHIYNQLQHGLHDVMYV
jgi:hypothetical protein